MNGPEKHAQQTINQADCGSFGVIVFIRSMVLYDRRNSEWQTTAYSLLLFGITTWLDHSERQRNMKAPRFWAAWDNLPFF